MRRLDRYIFWQLMAASGFFVLIFTGVIWLTEAVRLIDTVVQSNQAGTVFLEFSVLLLPRVLAVTLPLAAFSATIYSINKLHDDSEMVVMSAAGLHLLALARPVLYFGLVAALLALIVQTVLVPYGTRQLEDRRLEIRTELANTLIREGQFIYPIKGVTLFIDDTSREGEMAGIFLHDARDEMRPVTYSAERAQLMRNGDDVRLVMLSGIALTEDVATRQLSQVRFSEFTYDIEGFLTGKTLRAPKPQEYGLLDLLSPNEAMLENGRYSIGDYVSEGHAILVTSLMTAFLPLLAMVTLNTAPFQRSGLGRRVAVAVVLGILAIAFQIASKAQVADDPDIWQLSYSPFLLGLIAMAVMIRMSQTRAPRHLRSAPQ